MGRKCEGEGGGQSQNPKFLYIYVHSYRARLGSLDLSLFR